ncbi:hypothetical protein BKI52_34130 [marine bacterium AO1-C]|nr:hypothetical protein BKI52_34130 [marine bacterium AO1-C]
MQAQHGTWDQLLRKHVSSTGRVNYRGFKAEKSKLNSYINYLSTARVPNSRSAAVAFYINAYNAYTVKLIVDNYPTTSITKLKGGKPWDYRFAKVAGKTYTLNDIEHNILRKQYFDARLHFALVCAAQSCPKLLNKAYTAANLNTELDRQARIFVNNKAKNKISSGSVQVSQLFNWYKGDFTKRSSLVGFINKYSKVKVSANAKVSYLNYSWKLNE